MYVVLAGSGGPNAPTERYPTSPFEAQFHGGPTAAIASIDAAGCPVLVAGRPPVTIGRLGDALAVEALAILGDQLYVAADGGGAMHGNADAPSGVYHILADGTSVLVANLSAWVRGNLVSNADLTHEFDAAGYSIVADAAAHLLWGSDPNSSQILSVTPDGGVTRTADLSDGHPVIPRMSAAPDGGVYVGTLTAVPFPSGAAKVMHVAANGQTTDVWTGLTTVTDVVVGADGALYALEMSAGNLAEEPFLQLGTGRLVRQTGLSQLELVVDGLMFPVALETGPDGAFYIAMPAFGVVNGEGVTARVALVGSPAAIIVGTCAPLPETLFTGPATPIAATHAAGEAAPTAAGPTEVQTLAGATVAIAIFAFDPATLESAAGTTVTWTNNDDVPHTATAADGSLGYRRDRLRGGREHHVRHARHLHLRLRVPPRDAGHNRRDVAIGRSLPGPGQGRSSAPQTCSRRASPRAMMARIDRWAARDQEGQRGERPYRHRP